jgi:hypothetical protein
MHSTTLTAPMRDLAARHEFVIRFHRRNTHAGRACHAATKFVTRRIAQDATERALASDLYAPRRRSETRCASCGLFVSSLRPCGFCS